jgi:hypothetical protein
MQQLLQENEHLLQHRPTLEKTVMELQQNHVQLHTNVDGTEKVTEAYRKRIREIRGRAAA